MARLAVSLAVLCGLMALQGCATTVEPWQRGPLAKPEMAIAPSPAQQAFRDHVFVSREAAQGGYGGAAGGCGCN